jgi:hypothetical protein
MPKPVTDATAPANTERTNKKTVNERDIVAE